MAESDQRPPTSPQFAPRPGQASSPDLFGLAAELLARLLGIHISAAVAVAWQQRASAGDWAAYAADYSRGSDEVPTRER